jgi:phosphoribosylanthranilate isomerase
VPSFVSRVGVFVDADVEEIKSIVQQCGLTQLQLHGNETTEMCAHLKDWNMSLSLCKAFRVGAQSPAVDIGSYSPFVDSVLLDTYVKGVEGGTGSRFDWRLVESLDIDRPMILAGGLTPDNIREALSEVSPFAVDVNSGVEVRPGVKDHQKLSELIGKVAEYDYQRWLR